MDKDYSIRIRDGHHIVNMKPSTNEYTRAIESLSEGFRRMGGAFEEIFVGIYESVTQLLMTEGSRSS